MGKSEKKASSSAKKASSAKDVSAEKKASGRSAGASAAPKRKTAPTLATTAAAPGAGGTRLAAGPVADYAYGRQVRREVPRHSLGRWEPAPERRDPVDVLQEQAADRVPDLVPLRYERMSVSPFTFYRGAAAIMAEDLASRPHTGLIAQLAGDAHLANFGGFGTPEREMIFDLNDFDETHPGPFEWDVLRLVGQL